MSKERPILFSAPMVRALLNGTKTQTRRVVSAGRGKGPASTATTVRYGLGQGGSLPCPHGVVGDRLWVKETWQAHPSWSRTKPSLITPHVPIYRAGFSGQQCDEPGAWRPSIFMPRWASRLDLSIIDVRCERLNDISEDDAKAEGVERSKGGQWLDYESDGRGCVYNAVHAYHSLWDSINGPGAWGLNPWVWVVSFLRVLPSVGA